MASDAHAQFASGLSKLSIDEEDHRLIQSLVELSKKSPKLVRSSDYAAPADPSIAVRSWKMNEFKYYDIPSPFPTLARGLFTREEQSDSGDTRYKIVARGYDKFFNIGEVPWTTVSTVCSHLTLSALSSQPITDTRVVGFSRGAYSASVHA